MALQDYYIYLISTLSTLQFGMKPPFSFEKFLRIASCHVSETDIEILKKTSISGECASEEARHPALAAWRAFDAALRNALVKIRGHHLKSPDPLKFIRGDEVANPGIHHIALTAHRNPTPFGAEEALDEARWEALDELEMGHYFDLDKLIIYAHKLLILERWDTINTADKSRLIEELA